MIPSFPEFIPVSLELRDELVPFFAAVRDGICEHSFASLFLDSYKFRYDISRYGGSTYLVLGVENTEPGLLCTRLGLTCRFLHILGDFPSEDGMRALLAHPAMEKCCHLRVIPEAVALGRAELFASLGLALELDRDNSDYLYERAALAELRGKAFHKKKNLVNQFVNSYSGEVKPIADGTMYDVHFEKGADGVHGIYQAVNWYTARSLPQEITIINREQDLGDAGLRQAKLTYRPCGMVNKYRSALITLEKALPSCYNTRGIK